MQFVASALKGYTIVGSDGALGTVNDVLFDDLTWRVRWLVVETGTWLAGRKVLIHPTAVEKADHEHQEVRLRLTMAQIEGSPTIDIDQPVSRGMEARLYDYYGWDPLWGGSAYGFGAIASPISAPPYFGITALRERSDMVSDQDSGDPHLRSNAEVVGYHVHASDGEIGHVENLFVDDADWHVHYLVIDTRNWWPGRHVLISPHAVRTVDWNDRHVMLDVTRAQVNASPPWDPSALMDQAYQQGLHRHYGWQGYGW